MKLIPHPELADERVLAVLSPASLHRLPLLKSKLGTVFPRLDVISPCNLQHCRGIVKRSRNVHYLVIAVGGDGALHHVLQDLDLDKQVLGLIPDGTGNDLARAMGLPKGFLNCISHLASTKPTPTDYGTVGSVRFHNSAGFGIDSMTLALRERSRGLLRFSYFAAFGASLIRLRAHHLTVKSQTGTRNGRYYWVLGMNSPYIGGGIKVTPRAVLDDGLLDMFLVHELPKAKLACQLPLIRSGKHLKLSAVHSEQLATFECESREPIDYLAVDGELVYCGDRYLRFEIHPRDLLLLR